MLIEQPVDGTPDQVHLYFLTAGGFAVKDVNRPNRQFQVRVPFPQPEQLGPFRLGDSGLAGVVSGFEGTDPTAQ